MKENIITAGTGLTSTLSSAFVACGTVCAGGACCVPPLLSILGLSTYSASYLNFMTPLKPYLIGLAALSLAYGFFKAYKKPTLATACCDSANTANCCTNEKNKTNMKHFFQSKAFLWSVTVLCIAMYALPYVLNAQPTKSNNFANSNFNMASLQRDSSSCEGGTSGCNSSSSKKCGTTCQTSKNNKTANSCKSTTSNTKKLTNTGCSSNTKKSCSNSCN